MNRFLSSVALIALVTATVAGTARAQTLGGTSVMSPDGVSQVTQRLQDQQKRIDAGVSAGKITPEQAARDQKIDAKIADKLSKDEAKNGGAITKAEQVRLNKRLDRNSRHIAHQMTKAKGFKPVVTATPVTPPTP